MKMSTVTATAAAHRRESRIKRHIDHFVSDVISPLFWHDVFFEIVVSGGVTCGVVWALTSLNPAIYQLSTTHFAAFASAVVLGYSEGFVTINGAFFNPVVVLAFFITGRISTARCEL
jgi:Major intrinsic protein